MTTQDDAKRAAGRRAIEEFVRDGMTLGLGFGTTSHLFVRELGPRVADGLRLTCTATSLSTVEVAREVGIAVTDPDDLGEIDLTIDGPGEIDREFRMIKGGGACLLWEKIVAHASKRMITVCDETKIVGTLGAFPLPVEVVRFAWRQTERLVRDTLAAHGVADARIARRGARRDRQRQPHPGQRLRADPRARGAGGGAEPHPRGGRERPLHAGVAGHGGRTPRRLVLRRHTRS